MPSGYAVAIVILYAFLVSWFVTRNATIRKSSFLGWIFSAQESNAAYVRFYVSEPTLDVQKVVESLEKEFEPFLKASPPLDLEAIAGRKAPPNPRILAAVRDLAQRRKAGIPPERCAEGAANRHAGLLLRRTRAEMWMWLVVVAIITVAFGAYPYASHGGTLLARWTWITREMSLESARILLWGGALTLVSAAIGFIRVAWQWRPVRRRWTELLLQVSSRL